MEREGERRREMKRDEATAIQSQITNYKEWEERERGKGERTPPSSLSLFIPSYPLATLHTWYATILSRHSITRSPPPSLSPFPHPIYLSANWGHASKAQLTREKDNRITMAHLHFMTSGFKDKYIKVESTPRNRRQLRDIKELLMVANLSAFAQHGKRRVIENWSDDCDHFLLFLSGSGHILYF